jgi:ribosomal protein L14
MRETETCSSHVVFPQTMAVEMSDFKRLRFCFQRVVILNEEEDAEGGKVVNSVQVKVRRTYFPSV